MSGRTHDRFLGWAFTVALLLHGLALATAARFPTGTGADGDLEQIQVFNRQAPIVASPINLVDLPASQQLDEAPAVSLPSVPPPSPTRQTEAPPTRPRREPLPSPARSQAASPGAAQPRAVAPARRERPAPAATAGGGGGWIDLGSRSSRGDVPMGPSGETPAGGLPGAGTGAGSGSGEGSGSGSGGGSGSGAGNGTGTGQGPSPGTGGGDGERAGKPFVSRVADRAEPAVAAKGTLRYPSAAQEEGIEGTVKLKVLVSEMGSVAEVQVVSSSGDRRLDAAAKEWVSNWRYRPAVQDGKPRRVYTNAVVEFELK